MTTTRMACRPAANAAETRYPGALQHANDLTTQDGKLLLTYVDGDTTRTLTYTRYGTREFLNY